MKSIIQSLFLTFLLTNSNSLTTFVHAQSQTQETFNCSSVSNANAEVQSNARYGCGVCASLENLCRLDAPYAVGLNCTVQAQACFQFAVSPGTTRGVYDCDAARDTCSNAYLSNQSFCASQYAACQSCQTQEDACRNAEGANQSLCSSQAGTCYAKAITFNYEIAA